MQTSSAEPPQVPGQGFVQMATTSEQKNEIVLEVAAWCASTWSVMCCALSCVCVRRHWALDSQRATRARAAHGANPALLEERHLRQNIPNIRHRRAQPGLGQVCGLWWPRPRPPRCGQGSLAQVRGLTWPEPRRPAQRSWREHTGVTCTGCHFVWASGCGNRVSRGGLTLRRRGARTGASHGDLERAAKGRFPFAPNCARDSS